MATDKMFTTLHLKADGVHDNGNGTFSVRLLCECPTPVENATLCRLFPNTKEQVYTLLSKEALLASVLTEEEMLILPQREETYSTTKKK